MFLVEIGKTLHRLRTWVFATGLAGLAVLPVVVLATSPSSSGGPVFFDLIRHNGLFAALTVIGLIQPFFLPLGASLLSGEAIAAEASAGTLRYLVVRPVGRARLIVAKYSAVVAELAAAIVWVMVVALIAGGFAFGYGSLPTLFLSTVTDSGLGAAAATMAIAITSQILDGLPSLRAIHPYLITHRWFAFVDLFRSPVEWNGIVQGLILSGAYVAVFLGLALAVFSRKDVVS